MASLPMVAAVMLVNGRHEMVAHAVQSFMGQTYPQCRRYLIIWDTGEPHYAPPFVYDPCGIEIWHRQAVPTIGALRNAAITEARSEVIVTFDSDDWSASTRIAEQVETLQSSSADLVGYNELLFWDISRIPKHQPFEFEPPGEAWLYTGAAHEPCGTSLAFWRTTWQRHHFAEDRTRGEDLAFCREVGFRKIKSVSGIGEDGEPRLIATAHAGNGIRIKCEGPNWKRVPQFDQRCREIMEAA